MPPPPGILMSLFVLSGGPRRGHRVRRRRLQPARTDQPTPGWTHLPPAAPRLALATPAAAAAFVRRFRAGLPFAVCGVRVAGARLDHLAGAHSCRLPLSPLRTRFSSSQVSD